MSAKVIPCSLAGRQQYGLCWHNFANNGHEQLSIEHNNARIIGDHLQKVLKTCVNHLRLCFSKRARQLPAYVRKLP